MPTWEILRKIAFERKSSVAAVIRELIQNQVRTKPRISRFTSKDFTFVGSGRSHGKGSGSIARQHDEELADSVL